MILYFIHCRLYILIASVALKRKSDPVYSLSLAQQIQQKILQIYNRPGHNIIPIVRNWCIHSGEYKYDSKAVYFDPVDNLKKLAENYV